MYPDEWLEKMADLYTSPSAKIIYPYLEGLTFEQFVDREFHKYKGRLVEREAFENHVRFTVEGVEV